MDVLNKIQTVVFILGLIQGLIFSLLLIFLDKKKNNPTLLLSLFIFLYSINYLKPITNLLSLDENFTFLNNLPLSFDWLLFALFYLYIRNLSLLPKSNRIYIYLIPGILMFVIDLLIYFNVSEELEKFRFSESFGFIHHIGGHIYTVFIYFLTHVFLKKHTIEINNQYTSTIGKELYWAKSFMLVGVFFTLIIHFTSKFNNYYLDLTEAIINVGLLYWICIHGIRQQTVKNLVQETDFITEKRSNSKNEVEINETDKVLFNHIEQMIISKNIYKNPDLTIIDIANLTNKHPKKISTVINEVSNKNFKTFINGFRINEAKDILKNDNSNDYSIEGISLEVGFKSKSAFYDAFRKETGTTPTKFKNQQ